MSTVLAILPDGFEELEAVAPIDFLRRAGVEVTIAALHESLTLTGRNGMRLIADTTLHRVGEREFDCVFLPGGPGVKALRASAEVLQRVKTQAAAGRWLAAICAAPTVLHDAGLLTGRRFTAHDAVRDELPGMRTDESVVVDGHIITSRGAGTAAELGLELVRLLVSDAASRDVARSVCWPKR